MWRGGEKPHLSITTTSNGATEEVSTSEDFGRFSVHLAGSTTTTEGETGGEGRRPHTAAVAKSTCTLHEAEDQSV